MKQILLEHSGSSQHNKIAQKMQTMLEHIFECDVEQSISSKTDKINLYNERTMQKVGSFSAMPQQETLRLHIALMI